MEASELSTGGADVQQALNPEYPRPPKRKAAREAQKINEAEILASMPDPQMVAERSAAVAEAAAAEAAVERIGALPPPSVVHEIVHQVNADRQSMKKHNKTTSPPPAQEAPPTCAPDDPMSSSSSSSTSSASPLQGGAKPSTNQARHYCQFPECGKNFSSEWNLARHTRESCKMTTRAHSYEPTSAADKIDLIFMDKSKRRVSRTFLCTVSSLISYWLGEQGDRLELDTKWEHFQLLLDVHTLKVAITADNINLIAEQSKKYQLEHVIRMADQFMMNTNYTTPPTHVQL